MILFPGRAPNLCCAHEPLAQELTLMLDSTAISAIYLRQVGTYTKLVLGLLVILSITTILISPDPTDDVLGVMHQQHVLTAQPVLLGLIQAAPSPTAIVLASDSAEIPPSGDLLDLVCTRLC